MSDQIPIGSPPAPPGRHAAPPGWYSDPSDRSRERYWDGWQWSRNTREAELPVDPRAGWGGPVAGGPTGWGTGSAYGRPADPTSYQGHQGQQPHQSGPYGYPTSPGGSQPGSPPQPTPWSGPRGYGVQPGPTTADGVPLASWGARLLAALLDIVIIGLVSQVVAYPFAKPRWQVLIDFWNQSMAAAARGVPTSAPTASEMAANMTNAMTTTQQTLYLLTICVLGVAYYALFWRFRAGTPGQYAAGIRVVPLGRGMPDPQTGRPVRLAWSAVLIRSIVWSLPPKFTALLWLFWLIDGLWPIWNPRRQAIHDLFARTQVIRVR